MFISSAITQTVLFATLAGITIPLGAYLAKVEHISPNWLEEEFRHTLIAFGGGILIAAISFILVPQGLELVPFWGSCLAFMAGGVFFYAVDRILEKYAGGYSQLIAMMTDFIPEAMALGAMLTTGNKASVLLVLLIAFQNLPESFNAYREMIEVGHHSSRKILIWFGCLVLMGPFAALIGSLYLSQQPVALGGIMLFSAGGILYLVFQDIAPQAYLQNRHAPPLGALCGYLVGFVGHMLV